MAGYCRLAQTVLYTMPMGPTSAAQDTQLFRDVFNASPIGIVVENLEGQLLFANPAFCALLGFSEEELRSKHCVDFSPPEDAEKDWVLFQQLRAGAIDRYQLEKRYFRRDGSLLWGCLSISLLNGRPSPLILAMVEDITERKKAEEALRASEERLRLALEAGAAVGWDWDERSGRNLSFGQARSLLGLRADECLGSLKEFWDRVHPHDRGRLEDAMREAKQSHAEFTEEFRVIWPDGSLHWLRSRGKYHYGADGEPERMFGISMDIGDRKAAEEALRKSEEKFSKAFQESPLALSLTNLNNHCFIDVNTTFERLSGWRRDELIGRPVVDFGIWAHPNQRLEFLGRVLAEGAARDWEIPYRRRDGVERVGLCSAEMIEIESETCMLFVLADITDRKRAEEALRASEERLRLAQQAARIGTFEWNIQTGVNTWTAELEAMYGLPRGGFAGTQEAFEQLVHPDDRERVIVMVDSSLKTGGTESGEWRVVWPDGSLHWISAQWRVFMDESGEPSRVIGVNIDVSERKQAEEVLLGMNRRLIEAQESERARIGRELHDDVNQRLAMLAIELEQFQDNPSEVQSRVQDLRRQAAEISDDVQALSHELHSSKLEYLGVVGGMRSWCREFAERQKMEVDFKSEVPEALPSEIGLCLFRVLQEALHNAVKHSGARRVEVQMAEQFNEVHLVITDSGAGFDLEAARHGRGLGLTSMQERVRLVNGTITFESKPLHGTTIHARIPFTPELGAQKAAG